MALRERQQREAKTKAMMISMEKANDVFELDDDEDIISEDDKPVRTAQEIDDFNLARAIHMSEIPRETRNNKPAAVAAATTSKPVGSVTEFRRHITTVLKNQQILESFTESVHRHMRSVEEVMKMIESPVPYFLKDARTNAVQIIQSFKLDDYVSILRSLAGLCEIDPGYVLVSSMDSLRTARLHALLLTMILIGNVLHCRIKLRLLNDLTVVEQFKQLLPLLTKLITPSCYGAVGRSVQRNSLRIISTISTNISLSNLFGADICKQLVKQLAKSLLMPMPYQSSLLSSTLLCIQWKEKPNVVMDTFKENRRKRLFKEIHPFLISYKESLDNHQIPIAASSLSHYIYQKFGAHRRVHSFEIHRAFFSCDSSESEWLLPWSCRTDLKRHVALSVDGLFFQVELDGAVVIVRIPLEDIFSVDALSGEPGYCIARFGFDQHLGYYMDGNHSGTDALFLSRANFVEFQIPAPTSSSFIALEDALRQLFLHRAANDDFLYYVDFPAVKQIEPVLDPNVEEAVPKKINRRDEAKFFCEGISREDYGHCEAGKRSKKPVIKPEVQPTKSVIKRVEASSSNSDAVMMIDSDDDAIRLDETPVKQSTSAPKKPNGVAGNGSQKNGVAGRKVARIQAPPAGSKRQPTKGAAQQASDLFNQMQAMEKQRSELQNCLPTMQPPLPSSRIPKKKQKVDQDSPVAIPHRVAANDGFGSQIIDVEDGEDIVEINSSSGSKPRAKLGKTPMQTPSRGIEANSFFARVRLTGGESSPIVAISPVGPNAKRAADISPNFRGAKRSAPSNGPNFNGLPGFDFTNDGTPKWTPNANVKRSSDLCGSGQSAKRRELNNGLPQSEPLHPSFGNSYQKGWLNSNVDVYE